MKMQNQFIIHFGERREQQARAVDLLPNYSIIESVEPGFRVVVAKAKSEEEIRLGALPCTRKLLDISTFYKHEAEHLKLKWLIQTDWKKTAVLAYLNVLKSHGIPLIGDGWGEDSIESFESVGQNSYLIETKNFILDFDNSQSC